MACKTCRNRKIKCDGTRPVCQNCRLRSVQCTYVGERRTRRCTDGGVRPPLSTSSRHQLADGDDLQRYHVSTALDIAPPPISMSENRDRQQPIYNGNMSFCSRANGAAIQRLSAQPPNEPGAVLQTPTSSDGGHSGALLDRILQGDGAECLKERNPAVWIRATNGDEYTGPSSGISTISELSLKWVRDIVPDSDRLCKTVQDIRNGLLSHLRQPKWIPPNPLLTPPVSSSLKHIPQSRVERYVEAYFSTVQSIFPVLDQEKFEAQLAMLGTDPDGKLHSWKALLNAVLASGCRAALSEETAEAFQESGCESWSYFQNALSYETDIIHGATDLMAVQALAVMTIFAQGLSSPQRLEYTLSSIASRLAQSIGLNRHQQPGWNLSEGEIRERNRVFWVIYCLDKTIALRCGRPSMIQDDEISCCFPRGVQIARSPGTSHDLAEKSQTFDFLLCFTRLSRICGIISRRLYSATALYSSSTQLLSILDQLLQDLESWRRMIPAEIQPGKPFRRKHDTRGLSRMQLVVLHSSYYYVLCAVCRRFTPLFTHDEDNAQHLIPPKTHTTHIEAARSMVLLTKHLDVESFTPGWLVFYYPLTALTTIFLHVVSNPFDESTQSDIALMEVIVGFFGRLEYVTSGEAAFTKMTEFIRQARSVTDNAARAHSNTTSPESRTNCRPSLAPSPEDGMDTEETPLELAGISAMQSYRMLSTHPSSNCAQPAVPSPETGSAGTYDSWNASANRGLGIANEDPSSHSLYNDVMGLLEPPSGDVSDESWLGSWVPARF
ncbi:fungal-specific transcription factor domain-containing protein [Fusarium solani]|uniref:Fungal-specific transcription factor domain-containing protein n=1 Tax=Fusarium solani TaxID=169388 RepID=A0A9P9HJI5_FUSSL|nr:fungal-specific transcription factor domain-containing protein [Fusarium solani]KAH7258813.1 fungal-specific transcription factor domain-containing protein [Fusarium solani]